MEACSALGKAKIWVGILVNTGWWSAPKNGGPRDRSKSKNATLAEEVSAWGCKKTLFSAKKFRFWQRTVRQGVGGSTPFFR